MGEPCAESIGGVRQARQLRRHVEIRIPTDDGIEEVCLRPELTCGRLK
jgi:hypothetical protein